MGRWAPGSKGRLEEAALELFGERGYEGTTVADIAERAGLTKRTFFRYFADKREVLFSGSEVFEATVLKGVLDAPADASPLDAVAAGLDASAMVFEQIPDRAGKRQALLDANPDDNDRITDFGLTFYERLLAQSDAALSQGNLPRPEVEEGLRTLQARRTSGVK